MRPLNVLSIIAAVIIGIATSRGNEPKKQEPKPFRDRITLIGARIADDPKVNLIRTMAPDGTDLRTLLRLTEGGINAGRVAPDGARLVYTFAPASKKGEGIWLLDSKGQTQKIADRPGQVTAWSPDGQQVAFYRWDPRANDGAGGAESFVIDVSTKKETDLSLPGDYMAEDWHPKETVRTVMYLNQRNRIYREKGDWYPIRQLDLLTAEGKKVPITKDPSFDNHSSRFSPTGDRIVHYRRRFVDGRPKEFAVVSAPDGSEAKEVFGFTDTSDAKKLNWLHPHGFPCWSPDGKTIAWLMSKKDKDGRTLRPEWDLVFFPAAGGEMRRLSLTDNGFLWVQAIDWR
jgi:Tol biopolymer transport system component